MTDQSPELREQVAKAIWLKRPDCGHKPWPFDVMTAKERRGYDHNPIANVDLCLIYADAAIASLPRPTPSERPVAHNVGGFVADYSRLTPEEIAQSEPELDELYAHSVPAERPVAQVREALEAAQEIEFAISSQGKATLYELTGPRVCKILRAYAALTSERPSEAAVAWRDELQQAHDDLDVLEVARAEGGLTLSVPGRILLMARQNRLELARHADEASYADLRASGGLFAIPHGDAVRAMDRDGAAQAAAAIFDYADMNVTKFDAYGEGGVPARAIEIFEAAKKLRDLLSPTLASERVQATSVASATACDHLTTEKAEPWAAALEDLADTLEQMRGYPPDDADEKEELCSDLCGAVCCNEFGCMHEKVRIARSLIANQANLHGSEPEPTLASERVSERETMTSVPADRVIGEPTGSK